MVAEQWGKPWVGGVSYTVEHIGNNVNDWSRENIGYATSFQQANSRNVAEAGLAVAELPADLVRVKQYEEKHFKHLYYSPGENQCFSNMCAWNRCWISLQKLKQNLDADQKEGDLYDDDSVAEEGMVRPHTRE
jgi:hypothetical protein